MSSLDTKHAETQHPPTTPNGVGGRDRIPRQHGRWRRQSMAEYHSWCSSKGSITGSEDTRGGAGGDGVGVGCSLDECTLQPRPEEDEVDLERGELVMKKVNNNNDEEEIAKDCRICHLSLMENDDGNGIELGCDCKGDLGNAHKQCAETWFKIKGNRICEICGAMATNIAGERAPDQLHGATAAPATPASEVFYERRNYSHARCIVNVLLAFMIFASVISWLYHFS